MAGTVIRGLRLLAHSPFVLTGSEQFGPSDAIKGCGFAPLVRRPGLPGRRILGRVHRSPSQVTSPRSAASSERREEQ